MELLEFDCKNYDKNQMLIVYGTKGFGNIVRYCLEKKNITPDYYVEENGKGRFYGVPVINIDQLTEIYHKKHPIILLAVGASSKEVALSIHKNGIEVVYGICKLLEEIRDIEDLLDPVYENRYQYFYVQERFINHDKLVLASLDVVVTEKCSLKCEKCSNLMQYYQHPKNLNIEEIKASLDKVLDVVDKIYELRILGGEPFMNPDFYSLIEWYAGHDKITKIAILTNATIFPDEDKLQRLISSKVKIWLSDYGSVSSKLHEWIAWCKNNQVEYYISKLKKWQDLGRLERHNYSPTEIKYVYETCECNDCPVLMKGKRYNCPYSANAVNLGALYSDEAKLDAFVLDDETDLKERMKKFLYERDYLMACHYCGGRNTRRASIEPCIQTLKPLEYERRE